MISVILPVYNLANGDYLDTCINSVINNTYKQLEIIIINDGSTDNSSEIIEKLAEKDKRIIVVNKENGGVSSARNVGLDIAKGEWIAFIDGDDYIHPRYFEILINQLKFNDADIVVGATKAVNEVISDFANYNNKTDSVTLKFHDFWKYYTDLRRSCWGRIIKKSIIGNLRFDVDVSFGEDFLFNIDLISSSDNLSVSYIDFPLYYYFSRADSAIHSDKNRYLGNFINVSFMRAEELNGTKSKIYYSEILKSVLSERLKAKILKDKENYIIFNGYIKKALYLSKKKKCFTFQEKMKFIIMYRNPWLYKRWRIKHDPGIRDFIKYNKSNMNKSQRKTNNRV